MLLSMYLVMKNIHKNSFYNKNYTKIYFIFENLHEIYIKTKEIYAKIYFFYENLHENPSKMIYF